MSLSTEQQFYSSQLGVVVFGAALGAQFTAVYDSYLQAGGTQESVWDAALSLGAAQDLYPSTMNNQQFAQKAIDTLLGANVDVTHKTWAVEQLAAFLQAGHTRGDVLRVATDFVMAQDPNNVMWGGATKALYNKALVANYYSNVKNGDTVDVATLRKIVTGVTATTDVSSANALDKALLLGLEGSTPVVLNLSASLDTLLGQAGDDTFVATISSSETTLNVKDTMDGRGGNDTFSIQDTSNTAFVLPTPLTLTSIERLDLSHSATDARQTITLDVTPHASVKEVKVAGTGTTVETDITLGGAVSTVGLHHLGLVNITDKLTEPSALKRLDVSDVSGVINVSSGITALDVHMSQNLDLRISSPSSHATKIFADGLSTLFLQDKTMNKLTIDNTGTASSTVITLDTANLYQLVLLGDFNNAVFNTMGSTLANLDATNATGAFSWTAPTLAGNFTGKLGAGGASVDSSATIGVSGWKGGAGNDTIRVVNAQNNQVDAGAGNNTVTTGAGKDTISVGAGASTINSGAGMDRVSVGVGNHIYQQTANENSKVFASITGFNQGDKLVLVAASNATLDSAAIAGTGTVTLESLVAQAAAGTSPHVAYFAFEGSTYVVSDNSTATTFQNGADQVVKLTGVTSLSGAVWDAASHTLTL